MVTYFGSFSFYEELNLLNFNLLRLIDPLLLNVSMEMINKE
jgi:hypothetical protein